MRPALLRATKIALTAVAAMFILGELAHAQLSAAPGNRPTARVMVITSPGLPAARSAAAPAVRMEARNLRIKHPEGHADELEALVKVIARGTQLIGGALAFRFWLASLVALLSGKKATLIKRTALASLVLAAALGAPDTAGLLIGITRDALTIN